MTTDDVGSSLLLLRYYVLRWPCILSNIKGLLRLVWFMMLNATFDNILVISVLLGEETGIPGENHRPVASHGKTIA
jgi:hypothetical protein